MSKPSAQYGDKPDAVEEKLPLAITSIEPQKKNPDRFSLFHKKEFLLGVSGQTLLDYSIKKGVELTPFLFHQIRNSEEYQKAKDACYRYLSRRDHSSFELRNKVSKKGYERSIIDDVIEELDQKGLLNDEEFARKFALDKVEFKNWGPIKIKHALRRKGIDGPIAEKVVQNITEGLEQHQICVDLIVKKKRHYLREEDEFKRKQKIYRYLAGKGYNSQVIKKALPQIMARLNAE